MRNLAGDRESCRSTGRRADRSPLATAALVVGSLLVASAGALLSMHPPQLALVQADVPRGPGGLFPGFTADDAVPPAKGIVVTSLRSEGAAQRAGIRVGDMVEGIDGHAVPSLAQATAYLRRDHRPQIDFELLRDHRPRHVALPRSEERHHGA